MTIFQMNDAGRKDNVRRIEHYTYAPENRIPIYTYLAVSQDSIHRQNLRTISSNAVLIHYSLPLLIVAAAFDARFPNQNQTKHCWQNYVDFHKCASVRGEDDSACKQFYRAFHSLCPSEYHDRYKRA